MTQLQNYAPDASTLDICASFPNPPLLVRDAAGFRPAESEEVLLAAQRVLAGQMRGGSVLSTPAVVKDFLRARMGNLQHEVFAVIHLNVQHRVLDYVEMFRGTLTQTSVYPREVIKEALARNSSALLCVHNHPSGIAKPSLADEALTRSLKAALVLVDVELLDHMIVAGESIVSMAELGLV